MDFKAIEDFKEFCKNTSQAEVDIEFEVMQSQAEQLVDKIKSSISVEEMETVHMALSAPMSITLANIMPASLVLLLKEEFREVCMLSAFIGYYMGKTGDKLDGV